MSALADGAGEAGPRDGGPGILLVNDDAGALFALRAILSDLDADIVTAPSGDEALLRLLKQDFAVVVLDVKMAGLDGFETARLIRKRPRTLHTPIVFLTSHRATDLDRAKGYALGAADYIFMPVAPEVLKEKIQVYLDAARTEALKAREAVQREAVMAGQLPEQGEAPTVAAAPGRAPGIPERGPPGCEDAERLIAEHAGDFVALLASDGSWLYASASYQREFTLSVQPHGNYLDIVHPDDRDRIRSALALLADGAAPRRLQYRVHGQADRYLESEFNLVCVPPGAVAQLVVVSRDITERKEMEAYVVHQSFHDPLTGLPNRLLLLDRLHQETVHRERLHPNVAVLCIDIDHFKEINDTLGHAAGDRVLQDVSERLGACVRDGDTVARIGGDAFVVMLPGLHDIDHAALVADKIIAAIAAPCHIEGSELHLTSSIGIAIFPDDGASADTLLRNADIAMYHARRDGGGRFSFFAPAMQEAANRRLAMGAALQRAIAGREFVQYYQPKVCATDGSICGFEALIRWPQPDGSFISPSVFIPIAEETGRIEPISAWALQQAGSELQRWQHEGIPAVPIAVNLSALQFHRASVASDLDAVVKRAGIEPRLLEVELTETGLMSDPALAVETLHRIHDMGMEIAIDDFGTGYSSLAYLKRLPIDKLKIDASFVRDITTDPSDAAIVLAIITLAHVLNMRVIAEGVETGEQVAFLVKNGCDEMQGYYFSKAVNNDEAIGLLRRGPFDLGQPPTETRT
ncbi:EAL domain-containing response regulator [Massilia cavernae]|uniref:EAL domain-containing protein n=1 Tax=Massilia cavernae TaxID=2320864 RepID=A0A418XXS4_9BURK|nr:EAL domain-containing protein [Massilia cavernae]RJG17744.1 EAL domain-containing protein [Massilia cavernae]